MLFRLTNIWMAYNLVLVLSAMLPHRPAPFWSWINSSLYFLAFLLSSQIWRNEKHNRDVFALLSLAFLAVSSSFVMIFFGREGIVGSQRLSLIIYVEAVIVCKFLITLAFVFIALKYALKRINASVILAASIVVAIAAAALIFDRHVIPSRIYFASMPRLYRQLFYFNLVQTAAVLSYFVGMVRQDRDMGQYLTGLVVVYLFRSILEALSLASSVFGFFVFPAEQYFLTITLLMLVAVLFRKLCYASSAYGQYYEDLLHGGGGLTDLQVTRRNDSLSFVLLEYPLLYLRQRLHGVGVMTVVLVGVMQSLPISLYVRLNLIALLLLTVAVYVFFYLVYRRRAKSGFLLSYSREGT